MCSTPEVRLAMLRAAIDEVARAARTGLPGHGPEDLADRLAGLWSMIAELDPALAARLRAYGPDTALSARKDPPGSLRVTPTADRHAGVRGLGPRVNTAGHGEAARRAASMAGCRARGSGGSAPG
jgi:hypothetical protein